MEFLTRPKVKNDAGMVVPRALFPQRGGGGGEASEGAAIGGL